MDPSTRPRPFRLVVGVGSGIRDAWLIFGIVVFLLLGLDGMYRAQAEVRRAFRSDPADDIIAMESGFDSFPEYLDEQGLARNVEWQAYVGFRRTAFSGRYINVDSAGHRVTVQPNSPTDAAQQVLFFGGSTMFGTFQRDEWTIPSVAVRLLAEDESRTSMSPISVRLDTCSPKR